MNRSDKSKEDILREYIDHERIEKAPENFTQNVLEVIRLKYVHQKATEKRQGYRILLVVSAIITLILIVLASVLPGSAPESSPIVRFFQNVDLPVPGISFETLKNLEPPVWITYVSVAILFLGIFDRALHRLFHGN
jgi:hypothetical protein